MWRWQSLSAINSIAMFYLDLKVISLMDCLAANSIRFGIVWIAIEMTWSLERKTSESKLFLLSSCNANAIILQSLGIRLIVLLQRMIFRVGKPCSQKITGVCRRLNTAHYALITCSLVFKIRWKTEGIQLNIAYLYSQCLFTCSTGSCIIQIFWRSWEGNFSLFIFNGMMHQSKVTYSWDLIQLSS